MLLSPRLASGRHPPIILTSSRLVPIHQIGMLCCRARFGILCVEAFPERSNHFREPVHFPVIVLSVHAPRGKNILVVGSISPEHVQSVQDNISTSVPRENSQRESVPHFEDGLEELPRLGSVRA